MNHLGQVLKPLRGVCLQRFQQGEIFSVKVHKILFAIGNSE